MFLDPFYSSHFGSLFIGNVKCESLGGGGVKLLFKGQQACGSGEVEWCCLWDVTVCGCSHVMVVGFLCVQGLNKGRTE